MWCNQMTYSPYTVDVTFSKPVLTANASQYGLSGEIGSAGFSPNKTSYTKTVSSANLPANTPIFLTSYSTEYARVIKGNIRGGAQR